MACGLGCLGLIFREINGPAQTPNSSAREQLLKLNQAFGMGNNVMVCPGGIRHRDRGFLQKFGLFCDARRRREGVYQGRAPTHNFRGRKMAVVTAGNPQAPPTPARAQFIELPGQPARPLVAEPAPG